MERTFFEQVQDVIEGVAFNVDGTLDTTTHRRGVKIWFDDAIREHYEAQLIRLDGKVVLEVGFHTEHPNAGDNQAVLDRLLADETGWRRHLGAEPESGVFLGVDRWRRISETWDEPDPDDLEIAIEIAARLTDYVSALEHLRRDR